MERREKLFGIAEKLRKTPLNEPKLDPTPVRLDRSRRRRAR
jgi:hypothetical protein